MCWELVSFHGYLLCVVLIFTVLSVGSHGLVEINEFSCSVRLSGRENTGDSLETQRNEKINVRGH